MRTVFGLVLILGVALAGFAVYLARDYIGVYQAQLEAERAAAEAIVPTVQVFVSTKELAYGTRITKDDVRAVKWPQDALPDGIYQDIDVLFPTGSPNYRTVTRAMEKNEAIMQVKVTEPGQDAGVSSRLSAGMRAFAIRVDVSSGVSGFLRPGDRVDVYWTGRSATSSGEKGEITKLIETSVQLIAIDQTSDSNRASPTIARTVTVEVTPRQVAALAQAQTTGKLSLSLVGVQDETISGAVEIGQSELLGVTEAQVVEKQSCTIRTRRGAEIIEVPVACPTQ
ncbi:Flp pilus assembly protein CpaB [Aliiroseovarius lamellibrachiae]|uniref:Flp pilus assembly protein CpaB n=1 Tax=Aliiroseovarius lamellibrachiae TaxID=1924933 RepID=UPI001BE01A41|nr:Flp pilus assembly protein CpaB [Aliiroseovarius lamellibrachiae]MBT2130855.1 Flp pilus assembly protein CpaB [Aliiroseovarius lamellibrachiae]